MYTRKADRECEGAGVEGVGLLPVLLLVAQQCVLVVAVGPRCVGVGRERVRVAVERLSLEVPSQQGLRVRVVVVHKHHCCNKRSPPCSLNTLFQDSKLSPLYTICTYLVLVLHSFLANLNFFHLMGFSSPDT